MKLSLCIVTKNSAPHIEALLKVGRGFADEVVVAVDRTSSDGTEQICRRYADKTLNVGPIDYIEQVLAWLNDQCGGDWILRLDDDELPSAGLVTMLPGLLRDREVTHYWLRRRWVVGRDRNAWLGQRPWWPDWQLRLFKNDPALVQVPGDPSHQLCRRRSLSISHQRIDLPLRPRPSHRPGSPEKDRTLSPNSFEWESAEFYLLPEECRTTPESASPLGSLTFDETRPASANQPLNVLSIPEDDPPARGHTRARHFMTRLLNAGVLSVGRRGRFRGYHGRSAPADALASQTVFRGSVECVDYLTRTKPGQQYAVDLDVRNDSDICWASKGAGGPEVYVSYHWRRLTNEILQLRGLENLAASPPLAG